MSSFTTYILRNKWELNLNSMRQLLFSGSSVLLTAVSCSNKRESVIMSFTGGGYQFVAMVNLRKLCLPVYIRLSVCLYVRQAHCELALGSCIVAVSSLPEAV